MPSFVSMILNLVKENFLNNNINYIRVVEFYLYLGSKIWEFFLLFINETRGNIC